MCWTYITFINCTGICTGICDILKKTNLVQLKKKFCNNSSVKFDFHLHLYFTTGGLEVRNRDAEIPDRSQSPVDKVCC